MSTKYNNFTRYEAIAANLPLTAGKVFFVSASGDAWFERLQEMFPVDVNGEVRLFTNLDTAVGACTANRGDVIIVFPNYTLSVTAAAGLDLDVAGITIIGLGNGANRPTISLTTATTADIDIDAANITLDNFIIDATGVDAVAAAIDVNAADFTMKNCRVIMADSDGQALIGVIGATGAHRMTIENCRFEGDSSLGGVAAIQMIGGDGHVIRNNWIFGAYNDTVAGAAPIAVLTTAPTNILIQNNEINNLKADSTIAIKGVAATTGHVSLNRLSIGTDTSPSTSIDTPGSLRLFENYCSTDSGETGGLVGTLST